MRYPLPSPVNEWDYKLDFCSTVLTNDIKGIERALLNTILLYSTIEHGVLQCEMVPMILQELSGISDAGFYKALHRLKKTVGLDVYKSPRGGNVYSLGQS